MARDAGQHVTNLAELIGQRSLDRAADRDIGNTSAGVPMRDPDAENITKTVLETFPSTGAKQP